MPVQKRSVRTCIAELKRLNPGLRKLIDEKEGLIVEMTELCPHPAVLAARGSEGGGRRICTRCGLSESVFDRTLPRLVGKPTTYLSIKKYRIKEGLIARSVGIDF